ncbi:hypothetical protein MZ909_11315 [Thermosynechococcus sp. B0]|uniref:hypothetical protein n=1 Tax=unclassified Thermosynechococcus TaxID=2622553 RepID=UPI00122DE8B1|nr:MULTISPECIES: hypothetical protein [unclassified Thermosynechococcus]QEQ01900.1 hypothetical protein FFX45_11285 [Thermosynechococcus sp. CL-1]WJI23778.1 hypothetical protein MZ909_11315 [Thermosynechococcus sp. B0]WJI26291.1 hypothetical protein M0644_11355 [Thermosynechococcus sp. B1]WJI28818.1 hypothetical protein M0646_11350 [Thermosynechococcus sp. B3]WKT83413.1 hypothetical protein QYC28_11440 [Thermosynechococcus sp. HY596]
MTVTEILITLGAIAISGLVLHWLIRVLKVTVGTALRIALIVFLLQLFFGIGPDRLWEQAQFLWSQVASYLPMPSLPSSQ